MSKCPRCGSTAQVRELDTEYFEDSLNEILVVRRYRCGCECYFTGTTAYRIDGEEEIEGTNIMNEHEWCWWGSCYCKHACYKKSQAREYCEKDKSEACPAGLHIFDDNFEEDEENENV